MASPTWFSGSIAAIPARAREIPSSEQSREDRPRKAKNTKVKPLLIPLSTGTRLVSLMGLYIEDQRSFEVPVKAKGACWKCGAMHKIGDGAIIEENV